MKQKNTAFILAFICFLCLAACGRKSPLEQEESGHFPLNYPNSDYTVKINHPSSLKTE